MENSSNDWWKLLVAWLGTLWGHVTLNDAVLWATLVFTVVHTVVLLRNNFFQSGGDDEADR